MNGNTIFSRSAWGRNEARAAFNIEISKGTLGSIGVAKEFWMANSKQYEYLPIAVDELIVYAQNISPTENGDNVRLSLNEFWEKWRHLMQDNVPERIIFKSILVNTGMMFKDSTGVGRRQLQEKLLTEICNTIGTNS